jgi:hypothetical protein
MKALVRTGIVLSLGMWGASAQAEPNDFNGRWAVRMVTEAGVCDKSNSYTVAIDGGRVRYIAYDNDPAPSISGSVSSSGAVGLGIQKGFARADATGRLQGNSGSGVWRAGSFCSGRWTAQKRGPVQASN